MVSNADLKGPTKLSTRPDLTGLVPFKYSSLNIKALVIKCFEIRQMIARQPKHKYTKKPKPPSAAQGTSTGLRDESVDLRQLKEKETASGGCVCTLIRGEETDRGKEEIEGGYEDCRAAEMQREWRCLRGF